MRIILILCLVLLVAFSFGCSKKKQEPPKAQTTQQRHDLAGKRAFLMDPVNNQEVEPMTAKYSYEYKGVIYSFVSAENMEAFKANPEKYLNPAPAQQQQAAPTQQKQ